MLKARVHLWVTSVTSCGFPRVEGKLHTQVIQPFDLSYGESFVTQDYSTEANYLMMHKIAFARTINSVV